MSHEDKQTQPVAAPDRDEKSLFLSAAHEPKSDLRHLDNALPRVAKQIVDGDFDATRMTGVRTLTGDLDRPTGNVLLDGQQVCDAHPNADCFLSHERRHLLIDEYQKEVIGAEGRYQAALGQLRLERLIEKAKSQLPALLSLVLDVISLTTAGALERAAVALLELAPEAIRSLTLVEKTNEVTKALEKTGSSSVIALTKGIANGAKGLTTAALVQELDEQRKDPAAAEAALFSVLSTSATAIYKALRQKAPAQATDAQLLMLYRSFDDMEHTVPIYLEALQAKLERFTENEIASIGRSSESRPLAETPGLILPHVMWMQDRMVVRVKFKSGYPPAYGLVQKAWIRSNDGTRADHSLPLDPNKFDGDPIFNLFRVNTIPDFVGFVRSEFVDVALDRQRAIWGAEPETFEVDDSKFFWDQQRSTQAKAHNKAQQPVADSIFNRIRSGGAP